MNLIRSSRHAAAVLAGFAILLVSLAPTIGHVLAASGGDRFLAAEVCTAGGSVALESLQVEWPARPAPMEKTGHPEHCPFCFTHAGSFALPPCPDIHVSSAAGSDPVPLLFLRSPRPLSAWGDAQPRAPPFTS